MSGLWSAFRRMISRSQAANDADEAFHASRLLERCQAFRKLLAANNQALGAMAAIDELAAGTEPFTMNQVRSLCTEVAVRVLQMVQQVEALAPGRYPGLEAAFRAIQQELADVLRREPGPSSEAPLIFDLQGVDCAMASVVGAKSANLGEAGRLGFRTPPGFAATTAAYALFMASDGLAEEIDRRIQAAGAKALDEAHALSSSLQQLVMRSALPESLALELNAACARLAERLETGEALRLAVRSSAVGEDGEAYSFAGQYRSVLNVGLEDVAAAYKEVIASKYGVTAMSYRLARGLRDEDAPMGVMVIHMVDAAAGGVAYTADPATGRCEHVFVHAVFGMPKAVVDGATESDVYRICREPLEIAMSCIGSKKTKLVLARGEGLAYEHSPGDVAGAPCLKPEQALEVARAALALERHFGAPQDVEWAFDREGRLFILQNRPLRMPETPMDYAELEVAQSDILLSDGVTASAGVGVGRPYIVRKQADALRLPKDAVLVVRNALPAWASLLDRASAVVAELGGAAGHLAAVAREMGTPALFGASGAIAALARAEVVTVDADRGVVLSGDRSQLLSRKPRSPRVMVGAPVHDALLRAARLTTPLSLIDPDSPLFDPGYFQSLHDVTRFCHEKAVEAMFAEDDDRRFPQASALRLSYQGKPLQYWVVDLGGGVSPAAPPADKNRSSRLDVEMVACRPFRALWRGMIELPWSGPPALDMRGFASVVAQAASNPDLEPGRSSAMAMRNYFLISDEFMSLQSRFGFHFCTVEALICPVSEENFASFQFKGGAADRGRRVRRARLLADVLEGYCFIAENREDSVVARLEGASVREMENALAMLGYLLIHTRQLDMVMADNARAEAEFKRLRRDIDIILSRNARRAVEETSWKNQGTAGSN
ncbi:MAG: pyruvate, water dikinase [Desulfovibrionales bacterium]|nr:pyruvate, water dikinase [Desulfovibrionales bacterium]